MSIDIITKIDMKREIKFRVYGIINCYYLTVDGWKPEAKMCQVSSLNIKTNKCRVLYKGEKNTNEYDTFNLSDVKLMQFTGLKDKNGVEIYEGDIVIKKEEDFSFTDDWEDDDPRWIGNYKLPLKETNRDYVTLERFGYWLKNESFGYEGEDLQYSEYYEVIGNIYEHKHLLEK